MTRARTALAAVAATVLACAVPASATDLGAATSPEGFVASSVVFTGIRPGTGLMPAPGTGNITSRVPTDTPYCTANFVFQDAPGFDPSQQIYLGTAAHCVALGAVIYGQVIRPGDSVATTIRLGTVTFEDDAAAVDFALIAIDPALNDWVSPSVAYWGGPTAAYPGPGNVPGGLVGHGTGIGETGTARAGLIRTFGGDEFKMNVAGAGGDSGAPIVALDGRAAGHVRFVGATDLVGVETTARSVQSAIAASGKTLSTCPTATPWPLPGCPAV